MTAADHRGTGNRARRRFILGTFTALAIANPVGVAIGSSSLEWWTKPLLMPMLIGLVVTSGGLAHHHARLMVFGLAAATVADIALLIPDEPAFLVGMGFFLVMQACYIRVFIGLGALPKVMGRRWIVAVPAAVLAAFFIPLWNSLGPLAAPMLVYGVALAAMAVFATGLSTRAGVGGVLFLISDLLIGVNVADLDFPGRGPIIMATYVLAQYLLVTGWLQRSGADQRHTATGRNITAA